MLRDIAFGVKLERSSWVALRIVPSSHTNPIFVMIDGKPIRASRRSAEWCLKGVDQCWSQKQQFIKADEMEDARQVYDHASETYRKIVSECEADITNDAILMRRPCLSLAPSKGRLNRRGIISGSMFGTQRMTWITGRTLVPF